MMTAVSLLVGATVFYMGFLLGFEFPKSGTAKIKKENKNIFVDDRLQKEYRNFLNYDGTPQI